jgi:hypothetical protein
MKSKEYFYNYNENLINPLCSRFILAFDLTQALSLCVYYDLYAHLPSTSCQIKHWLINGTLQCNASLYHSQRRPVSALSKLDRSDVLKIVDVTELAYSRLGPVVFSFNNKIYMAIAGACTIKLFTAIIMAPPHST